MMGPARELAEPDEAFPGKITPGITPRGVAGRQAN